jgi:PGAP1-like protein
MADSRIDPPYHPIIYVRGYAGTSSEIEDTVSDPYMGFNLGSTRTRTVWTGKTERLYFESPLVRLMKDHGYTDVYSVGLNKTDIKEFPDGELDPHSIIIYRYYDQVSSVFGDGRQVAMEDFGKGLSDLILKVRRCVCKTDEDKVAFKVYLIGHSMGGLVIRCFLQNPNIGSAEAKGLVDEAFTYATPHNGIELDIIGNVPGFFDVNSVTNFNRDRMCEYLGLKKGTESVNTLNGKFDPDRFFCLVGTNPKDYTVAAGFLACRRAIQRWPRAHQQCGSLGIRQRGRRVAPVPARLRSSQPLGILRNSQLGGGVSESDALSVRRCARGRQAGNSQHHIAGGCPKENGRGKGGPCVLSF